MAEKTEITVSAALEFDKANGRPRIHEHNGNKYYNVQVYSNNVVMAERLILADTDPMKIREAIQELADYGHQIIKTAANTIVMNNFN